MRIVIDLQGAQSANRFRGIGRCSLSLALAMARQRDKNEIIVALNGLFPETIEPIRAAFDGILSQDDIRVWHAPGPVDFLDSNNDGRRLRAELLREAFLAGLEPDLVHIMSLFEGADDDAVTSIGHFASILPTTVTLHDLIPHIHRDLYLTDPRQRDWYYEKFNYLRRASLLLAVSESSRQEGAAHLPHRPEDIVTIPNAAGPQFRPINLSAVDKADLFKRYGIFRPFVMYTGGDDRRKNMDGLVRAYARLPDSVRRNHQLAIVCSLSDARQASLRALATECGLSFDDMILTGEVPDNNLVALYNTCTLFAFPSWHEGFGLPALEAMSCGAPVIGSNTASVPEVIGRSDAVFDPYSDASMSAKLMHILTDHGFRADLARYGLDRAKAFSWDESARRAIFAFEQVYKSQRHVPPPRSRRSSRTRLAYVTPWPPDRSGIADYSAELLAELSRHYDIAVITSTDRAKRRPSEANIPLRGPKWLRANAGRFDRVLYAFGNSKFHDYMVDLLADVPGTVVLHDFFLGEAVFYNERMKRRSRAWARGLYDSHGYAAVRDRFNVKNAAEIRSKYPANLQILHQAQGVIVHSDFSRHIASKWYGSEIARDWAVVPLLRTPCPDNDRADARRLLGVEGDTFLVCCFGLLGPPKLNDRALDAWLMSALAADERCNLVFVGENEASPYGAAMRQAIERASAGDRIRITGWVEPDRYRHYLAAADVALQLRAHSRGETSGAVLDCMNHGVPTITNACGALAELPQDAVWMLPDIFEDAVLTGALEALWRDPERRARLGARARQVIHERHHPSLCGDAYVAAIERFYERSLAGVPALIEAIVAQDMVPGRSECRRLAASIARNHPSPRSARRLFVDISGLRQRAAGAGDHRVTRSILLALLAKPPEGFRVEPVFAVMRDDGFRYARRFTLRLLGCPANWMADDPIDPQIGDIFLGLDQIRNATIAQASVLEEYRSVGVRVSHVVCDLPPMFRSDPGSAGVSKEHHHWLDIVARSDGLVTTSQAFADQLGNWLALHGPERLRPLGIAWWNLGADGEIPTATDGIAGDASQPSMTWQQSTQQLLEVITCDRWPMTWPARPSDIGMASDDQPAGLSAPEASPVS